MKKVSLTLVAAALTVALGGCSSFKQQNQLSEFNTSYAQGDYLAAAEAMHITSLLGGEGNSEDHLLELLHQAEAYRLSGDYEKAVETFDRAEEGMKLLDTASIAEKGLENGLAILVNDAERDYEALMSEAVLVNTYKALSFLYLANNEYARIEFNRADDRTRRAVGFFAEEIEAQKLALEEEEEQKAQAISDSLHSDAMTLTLEENYGSPAGWDVYPEFIVPSATYLHGLYFLASGGSGDVARAATSLERVAQMAPGSSVLAADAQLANDLATGKRSRDDLDPMVWLVYENGLGPIAEETRFDVPLILFHGNQQAPAYTGIALPRYADRQPVSDGLALIDSSGTRYRPDNIASMGKVVRTEMQTRFPAVLSRAVASAVVKALIQNEATEELGVAGQLGSALFAAATTQADVRSWQATPDHWEAIRFARPSDGRVEFQSQAGSLGSLKLPEWPFTLLYVKRPTLQSPLQVAMIDLQGQVSGQQIVLEDSMATHQLAAVSPE